MSVKIQPNIGWWPSSKRFFLTKHVCTHAYVCTLSFLECQWVCFFTVHILWFVACMLDSRLRPSQKIGLCTNLVHPWGMSESFIHMLVLQGKIESQHWIECWLWWSFGVISCWNCFGKIIHCVYILKRAMFSFCFSIKWQSAHKNGWVIDRSTFLSQDNILEYFH